MKLKSKVATGSASLLTVVLLVGLLSQESSLASTSQASVVTGTASKATLKAANTFLGTLTASQKTSVLAARTTANLTLWSNLPDKLFKRSGLRMDTLTSSQKQAVMNILKSALSPEGFTQVSQITEADGVLAAAGGMNLDFGADHYWIRFVGKPSLKTLYTIQYGGHHLAVNISALGNNLTIAPTLWGAQPTTYKVGAKTIEPLKGEVEKALSLMGSLDATQQKKATLSISVGEILTGAGADNRTLSPEGVVGSELTSAQKENLLALITEWMKTQTTEMATAKIEKAKSELDKTYFAWAGQVAVGAPIYYRITSPSITIEFSHQTGMGANSGGISHIHAMYREIGNNYGAALK